MTQPKTPAGTEVLVRLPERFNLATMQGFINDAMSALAMPGATGVAFDLTFLVFIEPEGVTALANAIEYFHSQGKSVFLRGIAKMSPATKYLDDAGFFVRYFGKLVCSDSQARASTMRLEVFKADNYVPYLYSEVMPWIADTAKLSVDSVETIKTNLEELFHNIEFHSGLKNGCSFAEYFARRNRIHLAISDWGLGIPFNVRTLLPDISDADALAKAIEYGFTTKSNVKNRGVGLFHLVNYFAQRNGGEVRIRSGFGALQAVRGPEKPSVTVSTEPWPYPGTLVHLVLRTDRLELLQDDVKPEVFSW
jgi:anti-sigma regulatory factor (Ser/Thr protein kinase)/anti-anti-sigma regulatory factor